jgi:ribose 5-phosphate isomerase B
MPNSSSQDSFQRTGPESHHLNEITVQLGTGMTPCHASNRHEVGQGIQRPMVIGIAADHGGYHLKLYLIRMLLGHGRQVVDFGDTACSSDDDYPDYVIPLAHAVASKRVDRGIAICGSGVGVTIAANKVAGIRACLINDTFSAHQGVEDDNMNIICLGGLVVGHSLALELVDAFLAARFSASDRHCRRLEKIALLEAHRS